MKGQASQKPDWPEIRAYYESSGESLRQVAEVFDVPFDTVKKRSSREKWHKAADAETAPVPKSGTANGTGATEAIKNGTTGTAPVPKFGSAHFESGSTEMAPVPKSGTADGTGTNKAIQNGTTGMAPVPESGSAHGASSTPAIFRADVTTYPNAMSPGSPAVDTVAAVLEAVRNGQFRQQIDNLRRILGRDGKAAYDREKTKLPAFCVSGTTADRKRILKHSNLLQIDFDGLNGTLADARRKVVADPYVAAAFTSPSGDGLKVLLRIDGSRHEDSVAAATGYFAQVHGLKHDPQVKEPARLCFVSHDPDLFENPAAAVFPLPESAKPQKGGKKSADKPWWTAFKGDLHTLDLVAAFREAGHLGECLDAGTGKWAVRCPWAENHGTGGKDWRPNDSSTVIFEGEDMPAFHCLHAHCNERRSQDAILWLESNRPGIIDRHCARMRGKFAAEALAKSAIQSVWGQPVDGANERLVAAHGEPFYFRTKDNGEREVSDFNPHYWAARFAFENLVIFEPVHNQFYTYAPETGIWAWQTDATIRASVAAWMLGYSRQLNQPLLDTGRTGERLTHMLTILKAAAERREPFRKFANLIHLKNCMIHLDGDRPEIRGFSPHYFSLSQCQVDFDPDADCPRFLAELIGPSMNEEDAFLLQLVGGLYLTGRNNWQKMLILTGVGGAGKGTIGRIIGHLIGSGNIKQLRTRLLTDRFELDDLDQVSLLVGSDVSGEFLSCAGAKVIKALTGGDPLTLELKGGRKRQLTGDHNILITCNDRLRVQLDGDESAWHRRVLIIPFQNTPSVVRPDFDRVLMEEEGSGILNWFLLGAVRLAERARTGKRWPLTPEQQKRVDVLLAESDSLRAFVGSRVTRDPATSLTVDEIVGEYENFCADLAWAAMTKAQAERGLGPLMMEIHRAAKRNDIQRGSSNKRGFMGVRLIPFDQTTDHP
jgi:phage/plasmid-associated DNA primase